MWSTGSWPAAALEVLQTSGSPLGCGARIHSREQPATQPLGCRQVAFPPALGGQTVLEDHM